MLPETFTNNFHDKNVIEKMAYANFGRTSMKVSKISLGTGGFSNIYGDFTLEQCQQTVFKALKSGINYIDTAPWYGQGVSELTLGKCLTDIPRSAFYIATKIGRYEKDPKRMFDFSAERTRKSIAESLQRLCLQYVDVIQIHDIEFAPSIDYVINETVPVLREFVKEGKARFIGVTGYPLKTLASFIEKCPEIDVVLSYSRMTLFDQELLNYKDDFKHLGVVNAAALGMGLLTMQGPQVWHPAHQSIKDACRKAADLCKKYGVDLAKISLHYALQQDVSHTVLSGINTPELLDATLQAYRCPLSDLELEVCAKIQDEAFSNMRIKNWENVEIENYKKLLI